MPQALKTDLSIIAKVILEHYDVSEVKGLALLPGAHQFRHLKMLVETEQGRFLAKTYSIDPVELDALRFQQHLSDHLANNDLPVARIKRAKDGKGLVEIDNWALELQEWIEAGGMAVNKDTLQASAEALGRFHVVCEDVPVPPRDTRMWRFSEVPRESFQRLYKMALAEGNMERINKYCNELALFLQESTKALSMEKRNDFLTGLIHGDWHGGNLLFQGNTLQAIIDLEFAGAGCYLEDLAYAISNLCVRSTTEPAKMELRTNWVLDFYQVHRQLSYAELFALYYAVGVKHVATISYQMRTKQPGEKVAGYSASEWMERLAVQCRWLANQGHRTRYGFK